MQDANLAAAIDRLIEDAATNPPDMMCGVYTRDYERNPLRLPITDGVAEVEGMVRFSDGDVMIFAKVNGRPMSGIILTRDAVWALKARA